jgi:hypothetical protein
LKSNRAAEGALPAHPEQPWKAMRPIQAGNVHQIVPRDPIAKR